MQIQHRNQFDKNSIQQVTRISMNDSVLRPPQLLPSRLSWLYTRRLYIRIEHSVEYWILVNYRSKLEWTSDAESIPTQSRLHAGCIGIKAHQHRMNGKCSFQAQSVELDRVKCI